MPLQIFPELYQNIYLRSCRYDITVYFKDGRYGNKEAMMKDYSLLLGLNTYKGYITCHGVAEAQGLTYTLPQEIL